MKYLVLILFILCSCTQLIEKVIEEETIIETETIIIDNDTVFCDIELYQGDCWSINEGVWNTIDLSNIIGSQKIIEVEVIHNGGDTTETIACRFRKNSDYQYTGASSRYNDYNETIIFITDGNGCFEWCHIWGAEEARKINLVLKLKMY